MIKVLKTMLVFAVILWLCAAPIGKAQGTAGTGTLDLTARITPTGARPEPVRQSIFYVLTKSYTEIVEEVEKQNALPTREEFIDGLNLSPQLKKWMKAHDMTDLTSPDLDKMLTAKEILETPELLGAYQKSNSGGVTSGLPKPKFTDAEKTENPKRYDKQHQEYMAAMKKFIEGRPDTVTGMEMELEGISPQRKWVKLQNDHKIHVLRLAPEIAQKNYLAAKVETDLEGHAVVPKIAPGNYWISTLNVDVDAGDARLRWDVGVTVQPRQTTWAELTNLNGIDAHTTASMP